MSDDLLVTPGNATGISLETKDVGSDIHRQIITGGLAHGSDDALVHTPVVRFLDTVGDGSGTKDHAADYSSAATDIKILPSGSDNLFCRRLVISIADGAPSSSGFAGLGSSLSPGFEIKVKKSSSDIYDITGGIAITNTEHLAAVCTSVSQGQFGSGLWYFHGVIDFEKMLGHLLKVDGGDSQYLGLTLHEDLSGLSMLRFMFHGLKE